MIAKKSGNASRVVAQYASKKFKLNRKKNDKQSGNTNNYY